MRSIDDWGDEGLCRQGTEVAQTFQDPKKIKQAKKICQGCPVQFECLQYAFIYEERGLWGGKTDPERDRYAKDNKPVIQGLILEAIRQGIHENRLSVETLLARYPLAN